MVGVSRGGCPSCDCDEHQNGSNPKRDDFSHRTVPSKTRGCSRSAVSSCEWGRSRGLLNGRVRDTSAGRAAFLCSHRTCYPVDRRLPSHLLQLTAGAQQQALSSNQAIDAVSGFRRKSSRPLDSGSEPLQSSYVLGVSVRRNEEKRGKTDDERCGITAALQHRREFVADLRGSRTGRRACAWSDAPASSEDPHVGLLVLSKTASSGCRRCRAESCNCRARRESARCWTVMDDPLKVLGSGT